MATNATKSYTEAAVNAFLAVQENITQDVANSQVAGLYCDTGSGGEYATNPFLSCMVGAWGKPAPDGGGLPYAPDATGSAKDRLARMQTVNDMCGDLLNCKVSNVDMSQRVTINLQTQTSAEAQQIFSDSLENSIRQNAQQAGRSLGQSGTAANRFTNTT